MSPQPPSGDAPSLLNAALVLRSGHAPEDLALAMGLSRSPMGHVQRDHGSLVLGTAGRWWLDDSGYQHSLRTAERAFTLGLSAHNAPVIHGEAQRYKRPTLLSATRLSEAPEVPFALVDLTACYPPEAGVTQVWRAVWLIGRAHLLVCDQVQGAAPLPVAYHWHGHPELSWCIQQGEALLASAEQPERLLRISSPQCPLEPADLDRLPGSRGQLTLSVSLSPAPGEPLWWLFSFAETRPPLAFESQTRQTLYAYEEQQRMPYVTTAEQAGIEKGVQPVQLGVQQGEALILLALLQEKFGLDSVDAYRERITTAEPEQLLQWSKRILSAETPETIFH